MQVKGENFSFAGGFTKRPDVVRYPKRDFFHENESLLKSLSLVREYWNLDKECANTYYIQTSKDMDYHQIQSINNVGITAGASTPNNIIEEVSKNVRNEL